LCSASQRTSWSYRNIIPSDDGRHDVGCSAQIDGEIAMKTILSALIALSLITTTAGRVNALDAKGFYDQQDRWSGGSGQ
jgi:hypothetical protein